MLNRKFNGNRNYTLRVKTTLILLKRHPPSLHFYVHKQNPSHSLLSLPSLVFLFRFITVLRLVPTLNGAAHSAATLFRWESLTIVRLLLILVIALVRARPACIQICRVYVGQPHTARDEQPPRRDFVSF